MEPDRFARHRLIQGFSQEALQAACVIVVGAGAIGNEVVKNLALLGLGKLVLVDFDRVELHNLTRSVLLREADIGQYKAAVVAARAQELNPHMEVHVHCGDVRDLVGLSHLASTAAVIAAVDNIEARLWLSQLCRLGGRLFIQGGIDHRFASAERYPFALSQEEVACYACNLPEGAYHRLAERYSCAGLLRAAQQERLVPTTVTTASLAGAHIAWQALRDLPGACLGEPGGSQAQRWFWDSYEGTSARTQLPRSSQCLACADQPALKAQSIGNNFSVLVSELLTVVGLGQGLLFPEPFLLGMHCQHCQAKPVQFLGQPSRRFSDKLLRCNHCGHSAVQIDSRELIDRESLASLGLTTLNASYAWLLNTEGEKIALLDFSSKELLT